MSTASWFGGAWSKGIVLVALFILAIAWWTAGKSAQDFACVVKGSQVNSLCTQLFHHA